MLNKCDLLMVRAEIAKLHRTLNSQAQSQGGAFFFSNEYVVAWKRFRDMPNIETAQALLNVAPQLLSFFENCCEGGSLYSINRQLDDSGN